MRIEKPTNDWINISEGMHQAVCCDVVDHGWQMRTFKGEDKGMTPKIQFIFQVAEENENGDRLTVRAFPPYVFVSWDDRSNWYKFLAGWLGKKRVKEIMSGGEFEPEDLIGVNAFLQIEHAEVERDNETRTYANIANIMPHSPAQGEALEMVGYIRQCDKPEWAEHAPEYSAFEEYPQAGTPAPARREASSSREAPQKNDTTKTSPNNAAPKAAPPNDSPDKLPQTDGFTISQVSQLAVRTFGPKGVTDADAIAQKLFGRSWLNLTADEAAQLKDEIRRTKPVEAAKKKLATVGAGDDDEWDDTDPFADE